MSRRSKVFTGEKASVATAYVEATNLIDLGADAKCHRLVVKARSSEAGGKFGYVVVSKLPIAAPATPLADPAQRVRFLGGELAGPIGNLDVTFDHEFRFIYLLSESGTLDVSVFAERV